MGQASASAASDSGLQQTGGTINVNKPNYTPWIIAAAVAVLVALLWFKKGK